MEQSEKINDEHKKNFENLITENVFSLSNQSKKKNLNETIIQQKKDILKLQTDIKNIEIEKERLKNSVLKLTVFLLFII